MTDGRIPALDGVRGCAVAAVLLTHLGLLRGGWVGVDVFFVLSGYLITSLLLAEQRRDGRVALGPFWARRVRRLLPALLVVVAAISVAWALAGRVTAGLRGDVLSTLTYWANWRFIWSGESYFASFDESPLRHAWSLAIEEQFYVVWPLAFVVLARARPILRLVVVAAAVVASTVWMLHVAADRADLSRAYYGSDARAATILIGCLAALLLDAARTWPGAVAGVRRTASWLVVAAALPLVVVAAVVPADARWLYRGGFTLIALLGAVVVIGAAHIDRPGSVLATPALVRLGLISYSLYLWHWPVILLVDRASWPRPLQVAVSAGVALALAELTYRLVERPARQVRLGIAVRRTTAGLVAVTALAIATTSGAAMATTTMPETVSGTFAPAPVPPPTTVLTTTTTQAPPPTTASPATTTASTMSTTTSSTTTTTTTLPPPPPPPPLPLRVTVVGDSVAWVLGRDPAPDVPVVVGGIWHARCDILGARIFTGEAINEEDENCPLWPDQWSAALAYPTDAVVVVLGLRQLFDLELDGQRVAIGTPAWDATYRAALQHAVAVVRASTAAPVLWFDVPCYLWASGGTAGEERDPARLATVNAVLRDELARAPGVTVVSYAERVCVGGEPDLAVRPDGTHLTPAAAQDTWRWLGPQIIDAVTGAR